MYVHRHIIRNFTMVYHMMVCYTIIYDSMVDRIIICYTV